MSVNRKNRPSVGIEGGIRQFRGNAVAFLICMRKYRPFAISTVRRESLESSAKAANYEIVTVGPIKPLHVHDHFALVGINHLSDAKHGFPRRNCQKVGKAAICRSSINLLVGVAKNHIVFAFEEGEK